MSGLAAAVMAGTLIGGAGMQLLGGVPGVRLARKLAHVSHELRGALTGADLSLAQVERHAQGHDDLRLAAEAARAQLGRVALASDDLDVTWSRSDHRRSVSAGPPVDLGALLFERARSWSQIAPGDRTVRARCDRQLMVQCRSPARLCQALDNLMANALEHGGGDVTIAGARAGGLVTITVRDQGPGVPAGKRAGPRGPWRLSGRRRGLGLEIAERAARSCGGRLVVRMGTPRIELPASTAEPASRSGTPWAGAGRRAVASAAVEGREAA